MSFYNLVPFEDSVYIIRAVESKPLSDEQLEKIDKFLKKGIPVAELQEELEDVWNS